MPVRSRKRRFLEAKNTQKKEVLFSHFLANYILPLFFSLIKAI